MNVINVSLDPHLLDPESVASIRARMYGTITERYTIIVPTPSRMEVKLSDNVIVFGSGGVNKIVRLYKMFFLLRRLIKADKTTVITTQDPYFLGLLGLFFSRWYHLGFEIQILGIEKLSPFRKRLAVFVLKQASTVRALSTRLYERLNTEFDVSYKKLLVVPIYVDVTKIGLDVRTLGVDEQKAFDALSQTFRKKYGGFVNFVTVSRLVPNKEITLQLQAVERLKENYPDIRLHVVGPDGGHQSVLEEEVRNRNIEEYVIFHGAQYGHNLGIFYLESDCFVLTSEYEGWGMVIIEAATAGLPIIMTDVGCAGEVVINNESALIIPTHDADATTEAMQKIITDPALRSSLSVGALASLKTLPDIDAVLALYRESWDRAEKNTL